MTPLLSAGGSAAFIVYHGLEQNGTGKNTLFVTINAPGYFTLRYVLSHLLLLWQIVEIFLDFKQVGILISRFAYVIMPVGKRDYKSM